MEKFKTLLFIFSLLSIVMLPATVYSATGTTSVMIRNDRPNDQHPAPINRGITEWPVTVAPYDAALARFFESPAGEVRIVCSSAASFGVSQNLTDTGTIP